MFLMIMTLFIAFMGFYITYKNSVNNKKDITSLIR